MPSKTKGCAAGAAPTADGAESLASDGPNCERPYAVGHVKKALRRILAATFLDGEPPSCSAVARAMGFPSMERRLRD